MLIRTEAQTNSPQLDQEKKMGTNYTSSYFDKKWTYAEYLEALKEPLDFPDPHNPDDPLYYLKYAHTIPPPDAYYFIPDRKDDVAINKATKNNRFVYFGWNNMTEFEI